MTAQSAGPQSIERYAVSIRDPEVAHAEIRKAYLSFRTARVSDPGRFTYQVRSAQAGVLRLDAITYGSETVAESEPNADLTVFTTVGGATMLSNGREEQYCPAGASYLYIPGLPTSLRIDHPVALIPRLAYADVLEAAEALAGVNPKEFRFLSAAPASPALSAHWRSTVALLQAQLDSPGITHYFPLVATETYTLLVHSILLAFPNTTMIERRPGPGFVASPAVRRAMEFIRANADRPITVTEIAAAVGVGPRGLRYAFRRHADVTPTGYLRRVRLDQAHEELRSGDPDTAGTVAVIAARHGFGDLGRFERLYAEAYGCTPTETLAA